MTSELRKLQLTQLYILLEVKRICEKYNINYFLVGGTLLGAARHQGFIPWDDDIDIGMPRKDYERFVDVCVYELSNDFFLQTKYSDTNCSDITTKVRLNGTHRLDAGSINTEAHSGVDIDIFPYDNFPSHPFKQWCYYNKCWFLRCLLDVKSNGVLLNHEKSLKKMVGWVIGKVVAQFLSRDKVCRMIDTHFQKYNSKKTNLVISPGGSYYYKKERQPREMIEEFAVLMFEKILFPVPKIYDEYLRALYGENYMDVPPENKRVQHDIVNLDLGKYSDIVCLIKEKYDIDFNN